MWQRWNQSSHIFEKSIDNGASWSPLGLNASIITEGNLPEARMPANVAYRDRNNNFLIPQTLPVASRINGTNVNLEFYDGGAPVDMKFCRWIRYQGASDLRCEMLNDAGSAVVALPIQLVGNGDIYVGKQIYQFNRAQPIGGWAGIPFDSTYFTADGGTWSAAANVEYMYYSLFGSTMIYSFSINASTLSGVSTRLRLKLPPPHQLVLSANAPVTYFGAGGMNGTGFIEAIGGNNTIALLRDISGTGWVAGAIYVRGMIQLCVSG